MTQTKHYSRWERLEDGEHSLVLTSGVVALVWLSMGQWASAGAGAAASILGYFFGVRVALPVWASAVPLVFFDPGHPPWLMALTAAAVVGLAAFALLGVLQKLRARPTAR